MKMEKLKTAILESCMGVKDKPVNKDIMSQYGFYFKSYEHNIFEGKMSDVHIKHFEDGNGNELYGKACATYSSSMIAYNFFFWIDKNNPLVLEQVRYTKVEFEKQFTCINGGGKANMDVVLTSEDGKKLLCIECKFTEPLGTEALGISDAYLDKNKTAGIDWKDIINEYKDEKGWYRYGIKQNISHLTALNKRKENELQGYEEIKFYNLIFMPSNKFEDEHKTIVEYRKKLEAFQEKTDKLEGLTVKFDGILTYSQIYEQIPDNARNGLKDYLWTRYIQHHE